MSGLLPGLRHILPGTLAALVLLSANSVLCAEGLEPQPWQHSTEFSRSEAAVSEYMLGLGALQKVGGRWRHKKSETLGGELLRVTWKINEGFTAEEGFDWQRQQLPEDAVLLYECSGRSCGSSAQWASRVFNERVLYGHDERQRYGVWRYQAAGASWTLVLYAVDRANRRHFLHMDLLRQTAAP
ncbi:MAG: DUF4892 domain-containing protein [Halieaceae bacterium]